MKDCALVGKYIARSAFLWGDPGDVIKLAIYLSTEDPEDNHWRALPRHLKKRVKHGM